MQGQDASLVALRDLFDLIRDDRQHLGRREPAEHRTASSIRLAMGKKLAIEISVEQRREQREDEVVGLLGCQAQDVVGPALFERAFQQFREAQRQAQTCDHTARKSKPVATSDNFQIANCQLPRYVARTIG